MYDSNDVRNPYGFAGNQVGWLGSTGRIGWLVLVQAMQRVCADSEWWGESDL